MADFSLYVPKEPAGCSVSIILTRACRMENEEVVFDESLSLSVLVISEDYDDLRRTSATLDEALAEGLVTTQEIVKARDWLRLVHERVHNHIIGSEE